MGNKQLKITLGSFDLAKGWGIISVILIHMVSYYDMAKSPVFPILFSYLKIIAAGIIPLFLIISGFRFREMSIKKMIKKSFKDFLIPYIWVMIGYAVVYPIVMLILYRSWPNAVHETMRFVLAFLLGFSKEGFVVLGYTLRFCSAAWYFLAAFIAFNILNIILKIKHTSVQTSLVLVCLAISYFLLKQDFFYYCIPQGLLILVYCYMGYLIRKYNLLQRMLYNTPLYFILILITLAEGIWGRFDIASGLMNHFILDLIGAGSTGLLLLLIGVYFGQHEVPICGWIKQVGTYSYWILAIHSVEMMAVPWILWAQKLAAHQTLAYITELIMHFVIIAAVCLIIKRIAKLKYRRRMRRYAK